MRRTINGVEVEIGPNADLRGANLGGADLSGANLRGAHLEDVRNLGDAYGLSAITTKPHCLPEGWEYLEGRGIIRAETTEAPREPERVPLHSHTVEVGWSFCPWCGEAV